MQFFFINNVDFKKICYTISIGRGLYMKKSFKILLVFFISITIGFQVNAKTLKDLKNELAQYEKEYNEAKNKQKLTEKEISKTNGRIKEISDIVDASQIKIKDLEKQVIDLENLAKEKEDEIKDVVSFLQITNSENSYMEYIFGAKSIEDLVLRSAISEQLVEYNDELIDDYNKTIVECHEKSDELEVEIENLNKEQENLQVELVKLGDKLEDTIDISMDASKLIDAQKKMIQHYESIGCKDDQNINTCGNIPYAGKMVRPVASGSVTSEYGMRLHPTQKVYKLHSGIDIAGGATDVYAVAPGTVAGISWKNSCGGTMLFVHHNINGAYYTSAYYHLSKVLVSTGDYVDQNTKIAVTGGTKSLTPWDTCTTGRHLHLSIARGLYMKEYTSWSTYTSKLVNPRTMVNFPKKGVWFSNRIKEY